MEDNKPEEKGLIGIKNWIGKIILMLFGAIWLASDLYDNIMSNFFLTEKEVIPWGTLGDYGVVLVATSLILGGWYLNVIFEALKSKLTK